MFLALTTLFFSQYKMTKCQYKNLLKLTDEIPRWGLAAELSPQNVSEIKL